MKQVYRKKKKTVSCQTLQVIVGHESLEDKGPNFDRCPLVWFVKFWMTIYV